eukprot:GILI01006111.1.p1 GENE.GILI01006111.1~~GILI01006111.1.p1  ORF type:complete len:342 (-),score=111.73 GILI01006111.1:184-1146(-)
MRRSASLFAKTLVLAEVYGGKLVPNTLSAVAAAAKIGEVTALVAGQGAKTAAAELAKVAGVTAVLATEAAHYDHGLPEEVSTLLVETVKAGNFTHVVSATSAFSKNAIPRAAVAFDSMVISDVAEIKSEDTFIRNTYAGNAVSTVKSSDAVKFLTVRPTSFERAAKEGGNGSVSDAKDSAPKGSSKWVKDEVQKTDKPELTAAPIVVSGGRGLKNKENFKLLDDLAAPMKAAVGATRAVVDAGYCPNDMQVGQTGKVVAPNLYIAVGLSGAIQHVAGMKDSKVIVAINNDADAPIFQVADYGLVADLFDAVPKLTEKVKA